MTLWLFPLHYHPLPPDSVAEEYNAFFYSLVSQVWVVLGYVAMVTQWFPSGYGGHALLHKEAEVFGEPRV